MSSSLVEKIMDRRPLKFDSHCKAFFVRTNTCLLLELSDLFWALEHAFSVDDATQADVLDLCLSFVR